MFKTTHPTPGIYTLKVNIRIQFDGKLDRLKKLLSATVGLSLTDGSLVLNVGSDDRDENLNAPDTVVFNSYVVEYDCRDVTKPKMVVTIQ